MSEGQKHMRHTRGPWHTQRPHGSDIPVWGVDGKSHGCVALVNMSAERHAEAAANARLIAAAPTMYEGIGDFLAAYDRARIGEWDHGKLIDWLGEQVARLRFVYAKAEGR